MGTVYITQTAYEIERINYVTTEFVTKTAAESNRNTDLIFLLVLTPSLRKLWGKKKDFEERRCKFKTPTALFLILRTASIKRIRLSCSFVMEITPSAEDTRMPECVHSDYAENLLLSMSIRRK